MKAIQACFFIVLLAACAGNEQKAGEAYRPAVSTAPSAHSEAFNRPFGILLNYYYALKDNLVDEKDSMAINHAAFEMMVAADSLPLRELRADSTVTDSLFTIVQSISAELKGLQGETDILAKRKEFQLVSELFYELIRSVRYDRTVIYHTWCPMAFSNQGAYWLSNSPEIRNPYIPKKMLDCGEVTDSVDFRNK